jgi:hypothetical protein
MRFDFELHLEQDVSPVERAGLPREAAMNRRSLAASCAFFILLLLPAAAAADIVTQWNERAWATMSAERVSGGGAWSRTLAMMHGAMFAAANDGRSVSPEAAVHSAARGVLAGLYPRQKPAVDAAYEAAIAALPQGEARTAGIAAGAKAAADVLESRKSDGFNSPSEYRPVTAPGEYVSTTMPVMSHVAKVKPFVIPSVSRFRPGGPPPLESAQWARDFNETKELGGVASTKRTAWQTETGKFWVLTGAAAWNEAARGLSAAKPLPLQDSLRLFAQLNAATFDATLAVFDAKYTYNRWRPVTAIRNGDRIGNSATERDPGWTPIIDTPMHPEYPCAHCTIDGAAGAVLKSAFGTGPLPEFTLTFDAMPGVTRKYTNIQQLEDEVSMARIWGGVHFRTSNEVGHLIGKHVGEYVLQNYPR